MMEEVLIFQLQSEIQHFHLNLQPQLQLPRFHCMFNSLKFQKQVIQLEEKKNGNHGLKTLKIMVYNKRWLQIQESHIFQQYNLKNLLKNMVWLQIMKATYKLEMMT
jgi:hypothetical protein